MKIGSHEVNKATNDRLEKLFSQSSQRTQRCKMILNELSSEIISASIKVHKALGPGLLESVYESALAHELRKNGLLVSCQVSIPVMYDGTVLQSGFRADMVVNDEVIVELKSIDNVLPLHKKQLLTYLRLAGKPLGLLINFNVEILKDGITRIIN